jgi:hypothetical protein
MAVGIVKALVCISWGVLGRLALRLGQFSRWLGGLGFRFLVLRRSGIPPGLGLRVLVLRRSGIPLEYG